MVCNGLTLQEREDELLQELTQYSDEGLLIDPNTFQGTAFRWLVDTDPTQVCPDETLNVQQRYILALFYYSMGGDSWIQCTAATSPTPGLCVSEFRRYLSTSNVCFWFGIVCSGDAIQGIFLDENNLSGELPSELEFLTALVDIDLDSNKLISGEIPSSLGNLPVVESIDLDDNQLSGPIPENLYNAVTLTAIDLDDNQLEGSLSPSVSNLVDLEFLFLDKNEMTGEIPSEIGLLDNLEAMHLDGNDFEGVIPDEVGDMASILELTFHNNPSITGEIPSSIQNLDTLQILSLHNTGISGQVPSELGRLTNLLSLTLHFNDLTGTMPDEICALRTSGSLALLTVNCDRVECAQPACCTACFQSQ